MKNWSLLYYNRWHAQCRKRKVNESWAFGEKSREAVRAREKLEQAGEKNVKKVGTSGNTMDEIDGLISYVAQVVNTRLLVIETRRYHFLSISFTRFKSKFAR